MQSGFHEASNTWRKGSKTWIPTQFQTFSVSPRSLKLSAHCSSRYNLFWNTFSCQSSFSVPPQRVLWKRTLPSVFRDRELLSVTQTYQRGTSDCKQLDSTVQSVTCFLAIRTNRKTHPRDFQDHQQQARKADWNDQASCCTHVCRCRGSRGSSRAGSGSTRRRSRPASVCPSWRRWGAGRCPCTSRSFPGSRVGAPSIPPPSTWSRPPPSEPIKAPRTLPFSQPLSLGSFNVQCNFHLQKAILSGCNFGEVEAFCSSWCWRRIWQQRKSVLLWNSMQGRWQNCHHNLRNVLRIVDANCREQEKHSARSWIDLCRFLVEESLNVQSTCSNAAPLSSLVAIFRKATKIKTRNHVKEGHRKPIWMQLVWPGVGLQIVGWSELHSTLRV